MLFVKIVVTPGDGRVHEVAVEENSTIGDALERAGISSEGATIKVEGRETSLDSAITGSLTIIVSEKVAGQL